MALGGHVEDVHTDAEPLVQLFEGGVRGKGQLARGEGEEVQRKRDLGVVQVLGIAAAARDCYSPHSLKPQAGGHAQTAQKASLPWHMVAAAVCCAHLDITTTAF